MKNKYLNFAIMGLAAITLATSAHARVDDKGFLDFAIKTEISTYADTMGTKDKFSNQSVYFQQGFDKMGEIAESGDLHKCSPVAKDLQSTYRQFEAMAKESIAKNIKLDVKQNNTQSIQKELYEGKTKEVVQTKMEQLREKAFQFNDCMRYQRPTK